MKSKKEMAALLTLLVLAAFTIVPAVAHRVGASRYAHQAIVVDNEGCLAVEVKTAAVDAYASTGLNYVVPANRGVLVTGQEGQEMSLEDLTAGMRVEIVEFDDTGTEIYNDIFPGTIVAGSITVTGSARPREYAKAQETLDLIRRVEVDVYYVADGKLLSLPETTTDKRATVLGLWLQQNNLPESVQLTAFGLENNGQQPFEGNDLGGVAICVIADTARLTLEVADTGDVIAAAEDTGLLLEGLCRTFLSYGTPYASCEATVLVNGQMVYEDTIEFSGVYLR